MHGVQEEAAFPRAGNISYGGESEAAAAVSPQWEAYAWWGGSFMTASIGPASGRLQGSSLATPTVFEAFGPMGQVHFVSFAGAPVTARNYWHMYWAGQVSAVQLHRIQSELSGGEQGVIRAAMAKYDIFPPPPRKRTK
jgi:hypothetical protein